ncbi:uncharacterized protein [Euphorbia lathyris]|uniref:uncharacterized protein n=1 Tax=Euphorbia lathyris TaxID=212925 RepID=UPI003313D8B1
MAASVESPSPVPLRNIKESLSSPLFSPASDKRFWSALRCRIDSILENRHCKVPFKQDQLNLDPSPASDEAVGKSDRANRMKEDSMLLLRGFDSIGHTLSQLSNNLDNAIQGARCLAEPPTLSEIFHTNLSKSEDVKQEEEKNKGVKRKCYQTDNSVDQGNEIDENNKLKKAKNLAISMATKAASVARELKSIKSDLCFMQERCNLLEEENTRLRDGFSKGIRPEEDDLMRLQMEALLAEKSRLANENANLVRENQCLHQLVEYHQLTSHDLSASYEQLIHGMCLDFSSPSSIVQEEEEEEEAVRTPGTNICGFSTSLDQSFGEEQQ